jgi:hypothetical protein
MSRKSAQNKATAGDYCTADAAIRPRLLPLKQAATYLGVTPWMMRSLAWGGKLPVVQFGSKKWFFRVSDLDRLVENHAKVIE